MNDRMVSVDALVAIPLHVLRNVCMNNTSFHSAPTVLMFHSVVHSVYHTADFAFQQGSRFAREGFLYDIS